MASRKQLRGIDYLYWVLTILAFFVLFLWVGDFGNLAYLTQSPITSYVETLWRITYFAGGAVFGVFMGSLVFLAVKFRESLGVTTTAPAVNRETLYYIAMGMDIVVLVGIVYMMFTLPLQAFELGILGSVLLLLFASITYLVYKLYFPS